MSRWSRMVARLCVLVLVFFLLCVAFAAAGELAPLPGEARDDR